MNSAKEFKKLLNNCQDTLNWGGSLHKYLTTMIDALEGLKAVSDKNKAKKVYREAYQHFRYALRSARRLNRYYGKIKDSLERLKPLFGTAMRKQVEEIEQRLRPQKAVVIAKASFFRGELNKDLNAIEARMVTSRLTAREVDAFNGKIRQIIAADRRSVGLVPFLIEVRNLQRLLQGVQRRVA